MKCRFRKTSARSTTIWRSYFPVNFTLLCAKAEKKVFSGVPPIKELLKRTEEHIKGMVVPGTLFEELGFNYIGPVDGHDVMGLISTLKNMRDLKGPQFLHIMTKKGRGYEPAEKDPITFHAVPKFDPSSGCLPKSSGGLPGYSKNLR